MEFQKTGIDGLLILKPKVWGDDRGYFFESYHINSFKQASINDQFLQDNESLSSKGVLRGLHFQQPPFAQGKLVRVITGSVLDVVVDIRKASSTYGKYFSLELNGDNKTMLWIPPGFAHGFVALEENTIFSYKCTNVYNKESEVCVVWNDIELNINWVIKDPIVSAKDNIGLKFNQLNSPF